VTKLRELGGKFLEHNPWGVVVFVIVALVGGVGAFWSEISLAEYLGVLAAAGGLLGLGHSVHKGAMHISGSGTRKKRDSESRVL
jgi:hypothetical protein